MVSKDEERKLKEQVREGYGRIAGDADEAGDGDTASSCCSPTCCGGIQPQAVSRFVGYSPEEQGEVPEGADLGLGCGNPVALASLKEGETVVDLGSGAGFDAFLAANRVGRQGRVIGVDMTPEMLAKARANAEKGGYENVEFREGEIEELPVEDGEADVVISNCVINLSPDKPKVFEEAFRVIRPGGRLMVSDIVLTAELPERLRTSVAAYVGCIAGASRREDYLRYMEEAGFGQVEVLGEDIFPVTLLASDPLINDILSDMALDMEKARELSKGIISLKVSAVKPE